MFLENVNLMKPLLRRPTKLGGTIAVFHFELNEQKHNLRNMFQNFGNSD